MLQQIESLLIQDNIKPYAEEILKWVSSEEFLKHSNQPFPPLLNPENIDYHQIPCEVAWELNLPLPQKFKFVYWGSHGAGNTGFGVFLAKYDGVCYYFTNSNDSKANYYYLYNQILHSKILPHQFSYLALRNFLTDKNAQKFHHLIYADKAINLIRDPISTLKHYIGMKRYNDKSARYFSLGADLNAIFPKLVGYTANNGGGEDKYQYNAGFKLRGVLDGF
ncbi:hypothetical protein [Helicobacter sp.]|uniref:hypothetical protein n=1 Tax=Helicobacter sp. TaxID=218 RepID=UPI0019BE4A50|nr:hypothetical protein [Helicobacter sp.]MBD5164954.1 hypothetical protein [Helicobacter sp.]